MPSVPKPCVSLTARSLRVGLFLAAAAQLRHTAAALLLNRANLYSIVYRLQTAKRPETKIKRMKLIIEMLARGEKFH